MKYVAGGAPITVPTRAYVLISLHYEVSHLVDLTDADVQEALKLDDNVLKGEWEVDILNGKKRLTQDIIVPSARNPGHKNTNFIVDQLLETSSIWIHDADGFDREELSPSAERRRSGPGRRFPGGAIQRCMKFTAGPSAAIRAGEFL